MSASILKSLQKLNSAVVNLEHSLEAKKKAMAAAPARRGATSQSDLFSVATAGQAQPANISADNVRMLASRLDKAINQVETILKEGRA